MGTSRRKIIRTWQTKKYDKLKLPLKSQKCERNMCDQCIVNRSITERAERVISAKNLSKEIIHKSRSTKFKNLQLGITQKKLNLRPKYSIFYILFFP